MAEHKSMNKYYPPNWKPSYGSLDRFHGTHPLGNRASKLKSEGILVIRFEIPYDIWCDKCNTLITQGTRFNADKKAVDSYFTTKIYSFRFNCSKCKNKIEIRTDPKVCFSIYIPFLMFRFFLSFLKEPNICRY